MITKTAQQIKEAFLSSSASPSKSTMQSMPVEERYPAYLQAHLKNAQKTPVSTGKAVGTGAAIGGAFMGGAAALLGKSMRRFAPAAALGGAVYGAGEGWGAKKRQETSIEDSRAIGSLSLSSLRATRENQTLKAQLQRLGVGQ